jgi:hypothetical protein
VQSDKATEPSGGEHAGATEPRDAAHPRIIPVEQCILYGDCVMIAPLLHIFITTCATEPRDAARPRDALQRAAVRARPGAFKRPERFP